MKRTQETLKKMCKILTESEKSQELMTTLAQRAEENGLTLVEWENIKVGILTNCFFMVAQKDDEIRNALAMDLYEEFNA